MNKFQKNVYMSKILLSTLGLLGGLRVIYQHLLEINACPVIGFFPICYLVTFGYLMVFFGSLFQMNKLFLVGWTPIFILALLGSLGEMVGKDLCPKSNGGIPMCYFSLLLTSILMLLFLISKKRV